MCDAIRWFKCKLKPPKKSLLSSVMYYIVLHFFVVHRRTTKNALQKYGGALQKQECLVALCHTALWVCTWYVITYMVRWENWFLYKVLFIFGLEMGFRCYMELIYKYCLVHNTWKLWQFLCNALVHYEKLTHYEKIGTLRKYVTHYKLETLKPEPETPNKNNVFTSLK